MSNENRSSGPGGTRTPLDAAPYTYHAQRATAVSNGGSRSVHSEYQQLRPPRSAVKRSPDVPSWS
jgi:hypothetical protein